MNRFIAFLLSIDGEYKPLRTAKRHSSIVMSILRHDDNVVNFKNLTNREFIVNWIDSCEGKPSTIKTYLGSIQLFFQSSVLQEKMSMRSIQSMEALIKQWKQNLWRSIQRGKYAKALDDLQNMPSSEQLDQFEVKLFNFRRIDLVLK